jgi:hypothetical protein
MFLRNLLRLSSLLTVCALLSYPAYSQQDDSSSQSQNSSQDEGTIEGTVVASSRTTFVVRSDDNQFHVFTFDRNTNRPRTLANNARVRVVSDDQEDREGARHATNVTLLDQAQGSGDSGGTAGSSSTGSSRTASTRDAAPVPPAVRNVENDIRQEARRWRLGARAGVGLNPELVMFGVHSQMGPVFSKNVFFRPNADFEWGEVTDMVALNLEAVYRMRARMRDRAWAPYIGGGPALNFIHQSFQAESGQKRDISFGNFDYETGFNILLGFQNHHGTFFEVKTSLYSQPAPVLRLIIGHNF